MLKLIIEDDEGRKTVVPFVRDEITIGRQEGNTIRLTERNVSRRHARLAKQSGQIVIEDLGSYNGIKVNGDRIKGQVQLADGDLVQIGDYDLAVQNEEAEAPTMQATMPLPTAPQRASGNHRAVAPRPDMSPTMPAMPVTEPPLPQEDTADLGSTDEIPRHQSTAVIRIDKIEGRPRQVVELDPTQAPRLVVMNTDFIGREFSCSRTELRIGRTDDNDIALDHRSLSRTHCKIVREDNGEWRVIDMQSANGLLVNGEPYAQVTLRSGDVIELGHVKLRFVGPGDSFKAAAASTSNVTMETDQPVASSSRGPVVAVVVTSLVVVAGLGGYFMWKRGQETTPPPKVVHTPPVPTPVPTPTQPDVAPPPERTPEEARVDAEKKLLDAEEAIKALDWLKAESILKSCKVGNSLLPKAAQLLNAMDGERGFRQSIDDAKNALAAGDHLKASTLLQASRDTKLLKGVWEALDQQRADMFQKATQTAKPVVPTPPVPVQPAGPSEEIKGMLDAARLQIKNKHFAAAKTVLTKCVQKEPTAYECYMLLGSACARLDDVEGALKYYSMFVQMAPKDHPKYEQVKQMLAKDKGSP